MPRDGSFALAFFGRTRKLQEWVLALSAGRQSFALKRILEAVFVIFLREVEKVRSYYSPVWAQPRRRIQAIHLRITARKYPPSHGRTEQDAPAR
jgi:hypothetical protein